MQMEVTTEQIRKWLDQPLYDTDGDKIGTIDEVYYDDVSGRPQWLLVKTGLFGNKRSFVPAADVSSANDKLMVPFAKDRVKDAPGLDKGTDLTDDLERALYTYYNLDYNLNADPAMWGPGTLPATGLPSDQSAAENKVHAATRPPSQCLSLDSSIMLEAPGEEGERLTRRD